MKGKSNGKASWFKVLLVLLYLVSFAFILQVSISGYDFYSTDYQKRPRHELYREFRPAGDFGHGVGVVGSAMMLFMLLYSIRKRTHIFDKLGPLKYWLSIHIYFGIIGPLLVVLHSSFKVQGLIAVSFWSMAAVALSGVLGRYLYLQIPRDISGEEIEYKDLESERKSLEEYLTTGLEINQGVLELVDKELALGVKTSTGLLRSLYVIVLDDIKRPFKLQAMKSVITKKYTIPDNILHELIEITKRKSLLERKVILLNQVQQMFHYWHVFHKPFAIIMYIIMFIHIGVAIWLGYTWIF